MTSWDYLAKFVIVGDSSVGKSSLLVQLTEHRFLADPDPTVGVEFGSHVVTINEQEPGSDPSSSKLRKVKVQCWDTAGSETFRSITRSYYRGAAGALLVYNVTYRPSFLHIADWLRDIREHAEENVSIILVGNMRDLCSDEEEVDEAAGKPSDTTASSAQGGDGGNASKTNTTTTSTAEPRRSRRRQVTREEAEKFAESNNLMFVETSAKTGENVEEAFTRAAYDIHAKFKASTDNDTSRAGLMVGNRRPGVVSASIQSNDAANTGRNCCTIT